MVIKPSPLGSASILAAWLMVWPMPDARGQTPPIDPDVPLSSCRPVTPAAVHRVPASPCGDCLGEPFLVNRRLTLIEDGTVPCVEVDTMEATRCVFQTGADRSGTIRLARRASGPWLEDRDGRPHAVVGTPVTRDGSSASGAFIVGTVPDADGKVACVGATGRDAASTTPATDMVDYCVLETARAETNVARDEYGSPRRLLNWATRPVGTTSVPHPDGAVLVSLDPERLIAWYSEQGAALNFSDGIERDRDGLFIGPWYTCHYIETGGVQVPAAKRPSTRSFPPPGVYDVNSRIRWLVANPYVTIANDSPIDPRGGPPPPRLVHPCPWPHDALARREPKRGGHRLVHLGARLDGGQPGCPDHVTHHFVPPRLRGGSSSLRCDHPDRGRPGRAGRHRFEFSSPSERALARTPPARMFSRSTEPAGRPCVMPARGRPQVTLFAVLALIPVVVAGDPGEGRLLIAERLPRIVHRGGPFLRRPEVTTVTFAGDDPKLVARLEAFGERIVRSSWWRQVADGYCLGTDDCIGPGRPGRAVRLGRRLPGRIRDVDVEALLQEEARTGALAGLGPDALVLVYLPGGVVLRDAFHAHYCRGGPRALHRLLRAGPISFPYAVVPRCGGEAETTATASHEIVEAATNPDPDHPGFRIGSGSPAVAFTAFGAEPVDPCRLLNLDRHRAHEGGFRVQRAWSNQAAARGVDPCVPSVPDRPYVALVPRQPVVRLASEGATASIVLDAASDRVVPGWTVSALDLTGAEEGRPYVDARLDRGRVANGDVAVLTLRVVRLHPRQISIVGLVSRLGTHSHVWPVAVSMR